MGIRNYLRSRQTTTLRCMQTTRQGQRHAMSTLTLDQRITAQRNKVAWKEHRNHIIMRQEGTSNKHLGIQRRATSSCCYDITLRQPIDRQTDRQTDKQIDR